MVDVFSTLRCLRPNPTSIGWRSLFRASFYTHMTDTLNTVQSDLSPAEITSIATETTAQPAATNLATEIMVAAAAEISADAAPEAAAELTEEVEAIADVPNGFVELGLAPELVQAVADLGYTQPTAVQLATIPKAMQGLEAQAEGKTLLTASDYDLAHAVAGSLLFHPAGARMSGPDVVNEASFFAIDPDTGLELKCRPDSYWMDQGVIYDIKTCQDASPRGVAKDFQSYGYPLQAAFYMKVLRLAGFKATKFVFVHVEKSAPFAVSVNELSAEYLEWAEGQVDLTLVRIAEASLNGHYPTGWSTTVNKIDLPRWLQADEFSN